MEGRGECVFIHGSLRRGASDGYQLADLPIVSAQALIRGHLWKAGSNILLVGDPAPDAPWVLGDVYRVDEERLKVLDDAHGIPIAPVRRMKTEVFPYGSGVGMSAWIWEWTGSLDEASVVPSGDWLSMEHPRPSPRLTALAFGCLVLLVVAGLIAMYSSFGSNIDAAVTCSFTALLVGCFATYFAGRRRERWALLRLLLWISFTSALLFALFLWLLN